MVHGILYILIMMINQQTTEDTMKCSNSYCGDETDTNYSHDADAVKCFSCASLEVSMKQREERHARGTALYVTTGGMVGEEGLDEEGVGQ